MKKIILFICLSIFSTQIHAQDNFAAGRLGFTTSIALSGGAGAGLGFGPGFSYQRAIGDNIAVGINLDFHLGSFTIINIEPRFDYFPQSVFEGFHVGTKIGINSYSFGLGNGLNLGLNLGYMFEVAKNVRIDIAAAPGVAVSLNGGPAFITIIPIASVGYAF